MSDYHDDFETADEAQLRADAEVAELKVDEQWRSLMGNAGNRACIWALFESSSQFQAVASLDPLQMMQSVAVRDFVLPILNRLRRVCPDHLALAERENQ